MVSSFNLNQNISNSNSNLTGQQQHHLQLIHLGLATPLKHTQKSQTNILD